MAMTMENANTKAVDKSNCNLCYPVLRTNVTFGDGMHYHTFREGSDAYYEFLEKRELRAFINWGNVDFDSSSGLEHCVVELCVRGIGKRPILNIETKTCSLDDISKGDDSLSIAWNVDEISYPEYLVELRVYQYGNNNEIILKRAMHVLPPVGLELKYRVDEVLWAPSMKYTPTDIAHAVHCSCSSCSNNIHPPPRDEFMSITKRGFGIELETVQLPPDFEREFYTKREEYIAMVENAKERYHHPSERVITDDENDFIVVLGERDVNNIEETGSPIDEKVQEKSQCKDIDCIWKRLLLWNVENDPQVENATPEARIDLYEKIMKSAEGYNKDKEFFTKTKDLILGGRIPISDEFLASIGDDRSPPYAQSSPEYKSPLPPHELYHTFPPPEDGVDKSDREISVLLNKVLKNEQSANAVPILVPTISDIGQSASSIHIHVNVRNPSAWPRNDYDHKNDLQDTQSLLNVVFNWIKFDNVIRTFSREWMWRDRSLSPMFASGPEFLWQEVAWTQGSTVLDNQNIQIERCNVPAFYKHVFEQYSSYMKCQHDENTLSLFDRVFDHNAIKTTLYRWCSLNLMSLKKYGTVEMRRMDASLDSKFVNAWTWFCVGFVEKFSRPEYFPSYGKLFLDDVCGWEAGLDKLINAQNTATIEELIEFMAIGEDPVVPRHTFDTLMNRQ